MSEAPRVAFVTLGCKVNQAETDAMASALLDLGMQIVREEDAEVVVITTCTVTGEADRKARKAVHHALAQPTAPSVVVTGCMAAVSGEQLAALGDRVIVEADKDQVPARVLAALGDPVRGVLRGQANDALEAAARGALECPPEGAPAEPSCADPAQPPVRSRMRVPDPAQPPARSRVRVQVKVEDGCDAYCAYCIVPYARGVPRSVPLEEVVRQVEDLAMSGAREVVLTGINIGRYAWEGARLADLVGAVATTGIQRIRLSSIEPNDVTPDLLSVASATPAFCAHLHVPLQSGSDATLARMGRPYSVARYEDVIASARAALPGLAITTDVIVGFPGESDAEWAETFAFVQDAGFARLHVFRYSRRSGTPAATMPGQVPPPVIAARAASLRGLGADLLGRHAASIIGTTAEVLIERPGVSPDGAPLAEGVTRGYSRVVLPGDGLSPGDLVAVRLDSVGAQSQIVGTPTRST